jgi:phosphoribosylanthranilate isomerase
MLVKVCGITRVSDARQAVEEGVDALGFVFWSKSPRFIAPERAAEIVSTLPARVLAVGVFVNESVDGIADVVARSGVGTVQLHGDEPPAYAAALAWPLWRAVTVDDAEEAARVWPAETMLLVDASDRERRGGTGTVVDWPRAATIARMRRVVLAGGLTPENVGDAIRVVQPYGVDVSSGVEEAPGVKNSDKVARFLARARSACGKQ